MASSRRLLAPPTPFHAQCVELLELPPLAACHHYINLTNGIEVAPSLQLLGLPYRCAGLPPGCISNCLLVGLRPAIRMPSVLFLAISMLQPSAALPSSPHPPRSFLRLPSTRCEQQQFEELMHDLDADLLMRLALGQT